MINEHWAETLVSLVAKFGLRQVIVAEKCPRALREVPKMAVFISCINTTHE